MDVVWLAIAGFVLTIAFFGREFLGNLWMDLRLLFDEAIAESVHGNNVLRLGRVGLDFLPQPGDVVVDRARHRGAVVPPDFVEQLIARNDFTPTPDQVAHDLEFAG